MQKSQLDDRLFLNLMYFDFLLGGKLFFGLPRTIILFDFNGSTPNKRCFISEWKNTNHQYSYLALTFSISH